jgi:anaerobic magnesium-protoporphyrin IX monomethyl ester cyclase
MRVLFVNPASGSTFNSLGIALPPLGLLYVAAAARLTGVQVTVCDRMVDPRPLHFSRYDVVALYCDTTRFYQAMTLARKAKLGGARVVMGGPHPGFDAGRILATGNVDAIVRGEGEQAFVALLSAWREGDDTKEIPGVVRMRNGRLIDTGPAERIHDVDRLPLPARDLVDLRHYRRTRLAGRPLASVHTSRGCPFQCRFCASTRLDGAAWRARSSESVLAELEELVETWGYRAVAFMDDNFTGSAERVHRICDGIQQSGWDLRWWCFCRVDTVLRHPEMIAHMARAGACSMFVGIESPSSAVLLESRKGIRAEQARAAVALLKRHHIEIWGSYILGFPTEQRHHLRATIRFARELDTHTAQFTILTPYPGTELWDELYDRLIETAGKGFDGVHAIYRHPVIPPFEMQLWHLWAYISFYMRSRKAVRGFLRFVRIRLGGLRPGRKGRIIPTAGGIFTGK